MVFGNGKSKTLKKKCSNCGGTEFIVEGNVTICFKCKTKKITWGKSPMKDPGGYLTADQIKQLLEAIPNLRDKALFTLLAHSGRRISEVLSLKFSDIDFKEKTIKWNILKKRGELIKIKPVDSESLELLRQLTGFFNMHLYPWSKVFVLSRRHCNSLFVKYCFNIGVLRIGTKKPHVHHLRHSFAVNFIKSNPSSMGLTMLSQWLEHGNIAMTTTYLQFSQEEEAKMLDKMWGEKKE